MAIDQGLYRFNNALVLGWFGQLNETQFKQVVDNYKILVTRFENSQKEKRLLLMVRCNCKREECDGVQGFTKRIAVKIPLIDTPLTLIQVTGIQVCPAYFAAGDRDRAGIYIHESTHVWLNTQDFGYYDDKLGWWLPDKKGNPQNVTPTLDQHLSNADTYARFITSMPYYRDVK